MRITIRMTTTMEMVGNVKRTVGKEEIAAAVGATEITTAVSEIMIAKTKVTAARDAVAIIGRDVAGMVVEDCMMQPRPSIRRMKLDYAWSASIG